VLHGIDLLEADSSTQVIVVTTKPPAPEVARKVIDRLSRCNKSAVVNLLGGDKPNYLGSRLVWAGTLEQAACEAVRLAGSGIELRADDGEIKKLAEKEVARMGPQQRYLRGLFAGGTLCFEALLSLQGILSEVYSNVAVDPACRLENVWESHGHTLVDMGEDEFTRGRAHPMIDSTLRIRRVLDEAANANVAVILLDIVLGYGCHPDPAGSLIDAIQKGKARAAQEGRYLSVVASVCGTEDDPQNLEAQKEKLQQVGVLLRETTAQAARLAGFIAALASKKGG